MNSFLKEESSPCRRKLGAKALVVLTRKTTWRCGKLERSIVQHLLKLDASFGESRVSPEKLMLDLNITGSEKAYECIDALRRLEKRNVLRIVEL